MTDGQGNTVYFSECVIIFTSNLGIYQTDPMTGQRSLAVSTDDEFEAVEEKVKKGIFDYFKLQLGRPEILNRIGENIVVFDFIREESAKAIMESQLDKIIRTLKTENNVELTITDASRETLLGRVMGNLENGGRGVGNIIEEVILNPLSSYLLDEDLLNNSIVTIENINTYSIPIDVTITGHKAE